MSARGIQASHDEVWREDVWLSSGKGRAELGRPSAHPSVPIGGWTPAMDTQRPIGTARVYAVVRRNLCNAYQSEANALALNNDFRNAIRYVEAAIDVDPRNPSPVIQLGSYYLRTDNLDAAIN
ncbi:MAG: hypothetical protein R6U98_16455, partial [Pirellulaceae bacterium]